MSKIKKENVKEKMDLLKAYDVLCQEYLEVENTDAYWERVLDAVGVFQKQYPGELTERLLMRFLDLLEEKGKILKACEGLSVKPCFEAALPEKYSRLLSECYRMIEEIRRYPELRKIYSDVNFCKLIAEIEEYREDLQTAEILYGN